MGSIISQLCAWPVAQGAAAQTCTSFLLSATPSDSKAQPFEDSLQQYFLL